MPTSLKTCRLAAMVGLASLLFGLNARAAQKQGPDEQTAALIAAFKQVHLAPEGGALSAADKEANKVAFAQLDNFFAYPQLCDAVLGPYAAKFSSSQRSRFNADFRNLVRNVSFTRSASFVKQAKVDVGKAKALGKQQRVDMHATVVEQDLETNVTFVWQDIGGQWQITDVDFDGVSFVKDYQNQFGKIIKKEGPEALLKKLASKLVREKNG